MFDTIAEKGQASNRSEFLKHPGRYRVIIKDVYFGQGRKQKTMAKLTVSVQKARPLEGGLGVVEPFFFVSGENRTLMTSIGEYPEYFWNDVKQWGHAFYSQIMVNMATAGTLPEGTPAPKLDDINGDILRKLFSAGSPAIGLAIEVEIVAKRTNSGGFVCNPVFHVIRDPNEVLDESWKDGA